MRETVSIIFERKGLDLLTAVVGRRFSSAGLHLLAQLLTTRQHQNNLQSFGVCHTCHHFQTEANGQFRCGLTHETLTTNDTQLICREHTP